MFDFVKNFSVYGTKLLMSYIKTDSLIITFVELGFPYIMFLKRISLFMCLIWIFILQIKCTFTENKSKLEFETF